MLVALYLREIAAVKLESVLYTLDPAFRSANF